MIKSIQKFNGLNGQIVSREYLEKLSEEANKENQHEVLNRVTNILIKYPEAKEFELEGVNPIVLTMPNDKIEVKNEDRFNTLGFNDISSIDLTYNLNDNHEIDKPNGLGLPKYQEDIYKKLGDQFLEYISQNNGLIKWDSGLLSNARGRSFNYKTKKPYKGVNAFMFDLFYPLLLGKKWEIPAFMTKKQVQSYANGKLKKDATPYGVMYFTRYYKWTDKKDENKKIFYNENDFAKFIIENKIIEKEGLNISVGTYIYFNTVFSINTYKVYNVEDIEGINWNYEKPDQNNDKIEVCEAIIESMPNLPKIHTGGLQPAYYPGKDFVSMPAKKNYKDLQAYYAILYHELVHSTKHPSRLNVKERSGTMRGNDEQKKKYASEEFVAELGSVYLCAESGILHHRIDNSKAYIKSWSNIVIKEIKEDPAFFYMSVSHAMKAAEYILNRDKNDIPSYQKKLIKSSDLKLKFKKAGQRAIQKKNGIKKPQKSVSNVPEIVKKENNKSLEKKPNNSKINNQPIVKQEVIKVSNLETNPKLSLRGADIIEKPKGIKSVKDVLEKKFEPIPVKEKWKTLIGDFELPTHILLTGEGGTGKSGMAFEFSQDMTELNYKVLYASPEQYHSPTLGKLFRDIGLNPDNPLLDISDEFENNEHNPGMYDFVVLDSKDSFGIKNPEDFEALTKKYPKTSFIVMSQSTKDGRFTGSGKWRNVVDVMLEAYEIGKMKTGEKNRWGQYGDITLFEVKKQITEEVEQYQVEKTPQQEPANLSFSYTEE